MMLSQRRLSSMSFLRENPDWGGGGAMRTRSLRRRRCLSAGLLIATISALGMTALRWMDDGRTAPDDAALGGESRQLGIAESGRGCRRFEEVFPVHDRTGQEDDTTMVAARAAHGQMRA